MLVTYSSGTTGKLSFVPRSSDEQVKNFFGVKQRGEVAIHWVEDCLCGWGGPRAAHNEFMAFVAGEG